MRTPQTPSPQSRPPKAVGGRKPSLGEKAGNIPKLPPPFTKVAYYLIVAAAIVMQYLFWIHRDIPADAGWVKYTALMTFFAVVGFLGTQLTYGQPLLPKSPEGFAPFDNDTFLFSGLILAASMLTQIVVQTALSFSIAEQATYFVFAAICEETFFRVFLLSLGFVITPGVNDLWLQAKAEPSRAGRVKLKGQMLSRMFPFIALQAVLFAAIHRNYYSNIPMLVSVFIGGIVLGVCFVWWRNPTANIIGHLLLNIIAVQNLLVLL